ncbi:hypothetical protein [Peterkaempfera bronchialis]|uniref:Uncharacterized protein n=1 Tax=Peterkaempfera bronchialis TaxID=2126346 RepID=A0A345T1Z2_9ACTN|nr:hypothetical protein [Peterkaempfera bronchialis]AXI79997.1 hypothetical protein C7M71_023940 [Peterkaempfera bronchialis]
MIMLVGLLVPPVLLLLILGMSWLEDRVFGPQAGEVAEAVVAEAVEVEPVEQPQDLAVRRLARVTAARGRARHRARSAA